MKATRSPCTCSAIVSRCATSARPNEDSHRSRLRATAAASSPTCAARFSESYGAELTPPPRSLNATSAPCCRATHDVTPSTLTEMSRESRASDVGKLNVSTYTLGFAYIDHRLSPDKGGPGGDEVPPSSPPGPIRGLESVAVGPRKYASSETQGCRVLLQR
jgi:hypothetical protein